MVDNAVAEAGTGAGADEKLVRVLEETVETNVLEGLKSILPKLVHEAVKPAIMFAVKEERADLIHPAPRRRRQRTVSPRKVSRPKAGGRCEAVWKELDRIKERKGVPTLQEVQKLAQRKHWNPNNARVEYYQWRKANGISGRLSATA